ncbi:hypothetical protein ACFE04_004011 [Oxalis oulophora]
MATENVTSCFRLPPHVNSEGKFTFREGKIATNEQYIKWMDYSMPRFEFIALFIIILSQMCNSVLRRLGLPVFLSQLIAGKVFVLLLESQIDMKNETAIESRDASIKVLGTIATIGYVSCVFQIGVKTDLRMIKRAGKNAVFLGCFPLIASNLCGLLIAYFMFEEGQDIYQYIYYHVITTSVTSFPVITSLLEDLKIVNSELGRIGQSAALISDILSMILINFTIAMKRYTNDSYSLALQFLGLMFGSLFVIFVIIRPSMKWIVRHTPKHGRVKDEYIYGIICIFLAFTSVSRWVPNFSMGPYILGLAIPTGPPLASIIAEKFDGLNSGLFMPLFIATCAMRMDFDSLGATKNRIAINSTIIGVTYLAKFGASFAILLYAKFPKRDGCALALIMCVKGFVELGNISFVHDSRRIYNDFLCVMWIAVVIIGCFTPILVKCLYDPSRRYTSYERNTIMHLSPNSNLQVLTCIHVPNNISAVTNLLEVSGASMQRPIGLHVLHLIKLSGQAAPIFVSHNRREIDFSDTSSYSENVILSFTRFEANNRGEISVNVSTAISALNLMYEDVCTLARDTSASLIILPFHRTWYLDGSIESDDNSTRVLNRMVLDTAPCSVGILVDRGCKRRPISTESSGKHSQTGKPTQNFAIIFLGGDDDREALVYAMRMAKDPNISLTVARFMAKDDVDNISWAKVLDSEVLKDVTSIENINYIEHVVKDGPETALILRSMMTEFDFFIIGRAEDLECQQTAGLAEWMEYPELGVIGDLLAVSGEKFSFLVVQQQHLMTIS